MANEKKYSHYMAFLLTPLLLCLFIVMACKDEKSSDNKEPTLANTAEKTEGAGTGIESFDGNFTYLTIKKEDLKKLFETKPYIQKIVFKFQFESPVRYPSLVGYGATSVRKFKDVNPFVTLNRTSFKVELKGELFFGNLEMSKAEYDELFKPGSGHENSTYLIFSPKISSQFKGNVIFGLSWDKGKELTEANLKTLNFDEEELNPSPPAKPEGSEEP